MPNNNTRATLARRLVNTEYMITKDFDHALDGFGKLYTNRKFLHDRIDEAKNLREKYNQLDLSTAEAEAPPEQPAKVGWFTRMIDKRIEAKIQKYVQAEIDRLIKLRKEKFPDSDELYNTFIEETIKRESKRIFIELKPGMLRNKEGLKFFSIVAAAMLAISIPILILTGSILTFLTPALLMAFAGIHIHILNKIPKEHAADLQKYIIPLLEIDIANPATFNEMLDARIAKAERVFPHENVNATPAVAATKKPSPHKHKRVHHHRVSTQSIFKNIGSSPDIGHLHHQRSDIFDRKI